jgi:NADPH:quinone reductase-like Zn-dependent oxidoreductase
MRYYKFSAAQRKLVMADAELPEPGPGQVRVRVAAASLNYRDVFMISRFGEVGIDNRIPLSDASGAVDAVGEGVTRFRLWGPSRDDILSRLDLRPVPVPLRTLRIWGRRR